MKCACCVVPQVGLLEAKNAELKLGLERATVRASDAQLALGTMTKHRDQLQQELKEAHDAHSGHAAELQETKATLEKLSESYGEAVKQLETAKTFLQVQGRFGLGTVLGSR